MGDVEVTAQLRIGGLGDLEGDERTLSKEALNEITNLAKTDLRNRYEDIDDSDEIHILAINSPNIAILKESDEE